MGAPTGRKGAFMNSASSLLAMGGYAGYVWSAYGLVFVVAVINVITIKRQRKRAKKTLQQWLSESY